jgi:hypothetical protein
MSDEAREMEAANEPCSVQPQIRDRSASEGLAANAPYVSMALLGASVFAAGLGLSPIGCVAAVGYVLSCAGGAAWVMVFICPWCVYHGTRGCPCGYGMIAARLRPRAHCQGFARQFRKHIPVLALLWLAPAAFGGAWVVRGTTPSFIGLLAAFAVVAFVVLPFTSRAHSCGTCPQRDGCPWMGRRADAATGS